MSDYKIYDRYARRIIEFKDIANAQVAEARPLNDYFVEVRFNDGRHGVYDMEPYLKYDLFKPLRDRAFFEKLYVRRIDGTVAWPGDIDLAPERMWTDMEPLADAPDAVGPLPHILSDKPTATIQLTVDEGQCFLAEEYAREHGTTLVGLLQETIRGYAAAANEKKED